MRNRYGRRSASPPRRDETNLETSTLLVARRRRRPPPPRRPETRARSRCTPPASPRAVRPRSFARAPTFDSSACFARRPISSPRADAARIHPGARRMERFRLVSRDDRVERARGVDRGGELRSIALDVGADAAAAYAVPGQFIQIRTSEEGKPAFIAVASAPGKSAAERGRWNYW